MHVYEHMIMWVYDLMTEILQIPSVVPGSLLHTALKTVLFHFNIVNKRALLGKNCSRIGSDLAVSWLD